MALLDWEKFILIVGGMILWAGNLSCIEWRQQAESKLAFLAFTFDCGHNMMLLQAPAASISLPCKLYPSTTSRNKPFLP